MSMTNQAIESALGEPSDELPNVRGTRPVILYAVSGHTISTFDQRWRLNVNGSWVRGDELPLNDREFTRAFVWPTRAAAEAFIRECAAQSASEPHAGELEKIDAKNENGESRRLRLMDEAVDRYLELCREGGMTRGVCECDEHDNDCPFVKRPCLPHSGGLCHWCQLDAARTGVDWRDVEAQFNNEQEEDDAEQAGSAIALQAASPPSPAPAAPQAESIERIAVANVLKAYDDLTQSVGAKQTVGGGVLFKAGDWAKSLLERPMQQLRGAFASAAPQAEPMEAR